MIGPANAAKQEVKMKTQESGWQESIVSALQDADEPLHYQRITEIIGERGLRTLTGASPATTVNSYLNSMTKQGHSSYDDRVRKVGRGVYEFASNGDLVIPEPEVDDIDDDEQDSNPDRIVRVPAFALYWDKDKVKWNSGQILGRESQTAATVNFADQQGVYILHKGYSVAYVGRTTDNLYQRLRSHNRDHKSVRWDRFSWFGFRGIDNHTGNLTPMPTEVGPAHLISILESVLIEALEPPVNGRRGDYLGIQYEQVPHPDIALYQSRAFLQSLTG